MWLVGIVCQIVEKAIRQKVKGRLWELCRRHSHSQPSHFSIYDSFSLFLLLSLIFGLESPKRRVLVTQEFPQTTRFDRPQGSIAVPQSIPDELIDWFGAGKEVGRSCFLLLLLLFLLFLGVVDLVKGSRNDAFWTGSWWAWGSEIVDRFGVLVGWVIWRTATRGFVLVLMGLSVLTFPQSVRGFDDFRGV